jgi:hypothetical protein
MRIIYVIIIIASVLLIIGGIYFFREKEFNLKKAQMDKLFAYFHEIEDSILAKHHPINMDRLKGLYIRKEILLKFVIS